MKLSQADISVRQTHSLSITRIKTLESQIKRKDRMTKLQLAETALNSGIRVYLGYKTRLFLHKLIRATSENCLEVALRTE